MINKKEKDNLISKIIGIGMLISGAVCFLIKSFSNEYIDHQGILHENFFLIPIGYFLVFTGLIVLLILKIKKFVKAKK